MKRRAAAVLVMLVLGAVAMAFDGKRQGFVIGGGVGAGIVSYYQTIEYGGSIDTSGRETDFAFRTDWLGFGVAAGVGYEFARGWSLELVGNWSNPSDSESGLTATTYATGLNLALCGLAY